MGNPVDELRGITAKLDEMIAQERDREAKPIDWRKVAERLRFEQKSAERVALEQKTEAHRLMFHSIAATVSVLAAAIEDGLS